MPSRCSTPAAAVVTSVPLEDTGSPVITRSIGRWAVTDHGEDTISVIDLKEGTAGSVEMPASGLTTDRTLLSAGAGYTAYFDSAGAPLVRVVSLMHPRRPSVAASAATSRLGHAPATRCSCRSTSPAPS